MVVFAFEWVYLLPVLIFVAVLKSFNSLYVPAYAVDFVAVIYIGYLLLPSDEAPANGLLISTI